MEINVIGRMDNSDGTFESANRVYGIDGIAPTLPTCGGGGIQPKVLDVEVLGGIGDINFGKQYRQGNRVYNENKICPALSAQPIGNTAGNSPMFCNVVAMRGRDKTNPNHRGPANENYEQRLEPREDGCSNTITTVQKDNMVLEKQQTNYIDNWTWEVDGITYLIRIRKLTPKECWRLMGFSDEDFEKAESVNSNTQLYKQAGNSIVKDVLCEIFKQLLK